MADETRTPDIKAFLSDPKHAKDKEFMFGVLDGWAEDRAAKAAAKTAEERAKNPPSIFDVLFGGVK